MTSPLVTYWTDLRGDRVMPSFADFDPTALPAILTDLLVVRVHKEPLDFEYSLIGSNVRRIHRENRRGQRMSSIAGQGEGSQIWQFCVDTLNKREPVSFIAPYEGPLEEIETVRSHATPWAGGNGEISRLVVHVCKQHLIDAMVRKSLFDDAPF